MAMKNNPLVANKRVTKTRTTVVLDHNLLRSRLEDRRMSKAELARRVGKSPQYISKLVTETGATCSLEVADGLWTALTT